MERTTPRLLRIMVPRVVTILDTSEESEREREGESGCHKLGSRMTYSLTSARLPDRTFKGHQSWNLLSRLRQLTIPIISYNIVTMRLESVGVDIVAYV